MARSNRPTSEQSAYPTRRTFLSTAVAAVVGVGIGATRLSAHTLARPGNAFLPERMDDATLQALAIHAIDVAKSSGVSYADVRLQEWQTLQYSMGVSGMSIAPNIGAGRAYSIRVLVDGTWGIAFNTELTREQIAQSVRAAVIHARRQGRAIEGDASPRIELVSASVLRDSYATPVEIDPFTVPLREHVEQLGAYNAAMNQVVALDRSISGSRCVWRKATKVFASTEGSLLTQASTMVEPEVSVFCSGSGGKIQLAVRDFKPALAGFEYMISPTILDRVKATADDAARWADIPLMPFEVGRYEVVMDGTATAHCAAQVLSAPLEMDRLLGYEADAAGTSYLAPIANVFGAATPVFSPLVTLMGTPTLTAGTSVRWDDEGVAPHAYTAIRNGRVVDAHTTRDTASVLPSLSRSTNAPRQSHGCLSVTWGNLVVPRELTLAPGDSGTSIDDLIRGVSNGLLIVGDLRVSPESGLSTAEANAQNIFIVKKGRVTGRAPGPLLLFRSRQLWNESLLGLGGPRTVETTQTQYRKGIPWTGCHQTVTAPAAHFKDVNVFAHPRPSAT